MSWKTGVEKALSSKLNSEIKILSDRFTGGGSINDARIIKTTSGYYFVKVNSAALYPAMFEKEAKGLTLLKKTGVVTVPAVIAYGEEKEDAFLILEYINSSTAASGYWKRLGEELAALHRHTASSFGLDHNNYIGSLSQSNKHHHTWSSFFREERLEPQVVLAFNNGRIDKELIKQFDTFYHRLENLFPKEPPSFIHGDLWGGNVMTGKNGEPVIIDPAVYYGHREMDLGMSMLFGGFNQKFYDSYAQAYPLESGWRERMDFCNLYPLMVHVNLFGGGYAGSVKSILKRF